MLKKLKIYKALILAKLYNLFRRLRIRLIIFLAGKDTVAINLSIINGRIILSQQGCSILHNITIQGAATGVIIK